MVEIKISGRGGQGAVLASRALAASFFENGMWVQSFPSFGAERRGAPVSAFLRADSDEITLRCGIYHLDWLILFEPNLLENPLVTAGVTEKTSILVNGASLPNSLKSKGQGRIFVVDATAIAQKLGLTALSFPIVNTAMLGAFAKASSLVDLNSIIRAVENIVPVKKEKNAAAAREAYEKVHEVIQ